MNRDVERYAKAMPGARRYSRGLAARTTERFKGCFVHPDREQLNRELSLRLEERHRERQRIARELHDTLFQGFFGVSLQFHAAVEQVPADSPGKASLCRSLHLMQRVIDEGRGALQGLRSAANTSAKSLEQTLSGIRDEFTSGGGVPFRVFVKGQQRPLKPAVQEQIYMIGREAVVNALRHSEATNIEAEVEYLPRRLRVVVRDNGRGMDPQVVSSGRHAHWGLRGMRERAESIGARLRIWSKPGAGTEVELSVPGHLVADCGA